MKGTDSCIGYKDIDLAKVRHGDIDQLLTRCRICNVPLDGNCAPTKLADLFYGFFCSQVAAVRSIVMAPIVDDDIGPLSRGLDRDCAPNTSRAARNDHYFV